MSDEAFPSGAGRCGQRGVRCECALIHSVRGDGNSLAKRRWQPKEAIQNTMLSLKKEPRKVAGLIQIMDATNGSRR
jgi:hypothetical protein